MGGTDVSFGINQHGVGTYAVVDDVLTMTYDTFDSTIHEGHGTAITDTDQHPETYADDAVDLADNGDGTITINRVTLPVIEFPPVAGGPMGCDDDTMSLGFTSGLADGGRLRSHVVTGPRLIRHAWARDCGRLVPRPNTSRC